MRRTIETLRRARQRHDTGWWAYYGRLCPKAASSGGDASSSSEGDGSSGPKAATSTLVAHSPIAARDCWRACRATSAGVGSGLEGEWVLCAHCRKARTMALRLVSRRTTNLPVLGMDHWARRYRDAVTTNRERGGKCRCGSVNSPSADDSTSSSVRVPEKPGVTIATVAPAIGFPVCESMTMPTHPNSGLWLGSTSSDCGLAGTAGCLLPKVRFESPRRQRNANQMRIKQPLANHRARRFPLTGFKCKVVVETASLVQAAEAAT